jgi:hypothetical protein
MKLKENAFLWILTGFGAVALALAINVEREPSSFFIAARVVVCFASAYAGVKAYQAKKEVWTWLLGANAALYNPFVLVRLTREIWDIVAIFDIGLLVAAAIVLRAREERIAYFKDSSSATPNVPAVLAKEKEYRMPSRTELATLLTLLFLFLASIFISQYYASYGGATQTDAQNRNVGSATLGLAFWMYVIARVKHWRRPWRIALSGFVLSLATLFAASVGGVYTKGVERREVIASVERSIERFDPALAARLKADSGVDEVSLSAMMGHSFSRAIDQAPDIAVVKFIAEQFAIIQNDSPAALERCVAAFKGKRGGDFHLNEHEQLRMMRALENLYSAAAVAHKPNPTDTERKAATAALTVILKKVDPDGIFDDGERMKTLSEQNQCDLYTRLMQELQSVPPKEGAEVIRLISGWRDAPSAVSTQENTREVPFTGELDAPQPK